MCVLRRCSAHAEATGQDKIFVPVVLPQLNNACNSQLGCGETTIERLINNKSKGEKEKRQKK